MIFVFFVLLLIFLVIIIFAFPQLSPIPYFPSNRKDLSLIINTLDLKNDQIIFDLGAGDGIIIFTAAKKAHEKKLNTKFIATEINPVLLLILNIRRLFHQNRNNIKIMYADMFKMDLSMYGQDNVLSLLFYLYISPWYLEKTLKNIEKQLSRFNLVSYMYPIKSLKKHEKMTKGQHNIYKYSCV